MAAAEEPQCEQPPPPTQTSRRNATKLILIIKFLLRTNPHTTTATVPPTPTASSAVARPLPRTLHAVLTATVNPNRVAPRSLKPMQGLGPCPRRHLNLNLVERSERIAFQR